MKKFYYKKEVSVDKSPIILPLERRHTMNVNKDGTGQEQSRLSVRATSVGSFEQLNNASAVPKIKTREITKCLSEDVLHRGHLSNSTKVITERELSSSRLYKTRKASINSKDSPQRTPQQDHLTPVVLKDPKLKPIPVKSKLRNKDYCLCYFSIFIVISLCTIGFLAAITGLLYSEIFADKNSTLYPVQETVIDITNLIQETQSQVNSSTYGFQIHSNETILRKISFDNTDYEPHETRSSASNLTKSENIYTDELGKLDVTDLTQFLDSTKAEIKFQDRDTIIYEVNASSSAEYENDTKILSDMKKETDSNENITGNDSKNMDELTDKVSKENKGENFEMILNPLVDKLKDQLVIGRNQELKNSDLILDDVKLEDSLINSTSSADINSESDPITYTESNESDTFAVEKHQKAKSNKEMDVPSVEGQNETLPTLKGKVAWMVGDPIKLINDDQGTETESTEESLSENTDQMHNKSEHDVESMLMVINESEDEFQDPVVVNRNGDISLIVETSSFEAGHTSSHFPLKEEIDDIVKLSTKPQNFLENLATNEQKLRIKPLDMKVSLVEAMKHLQALDVNNKLPTSRIKSGKIKAQIKKPVKLSNKPRSKENMNMEKMQYLKNLRLVLQENLQGL